MPHRERKKDSSPRWFFWLMGIYMVVLIAIIIAHDKITMYRKGMGDYWWAYLLPVAIGLVVGLITYFIVTHRGAEKSDKWFFNLALGFTGMAVLGTPVSLVLVIINDLSDTVVTEEEYRIVSWESSHTSKGGTKYSIDMVDAAGNERSLTLKHGFGDSFTRFSKVRLRVQEGCFGGRFIDITSSDYGIFSGERIPETVD